MATIKPPRIFNLLPFLLSVGTNTFLSSGRYNHVLLFCQLALISFCGVLTLVSMRESGDDPSEVLHKSHDLVVVIMFVMFFLVVMFKSQQTSWLVDYIRRPFDNVDSNSPHYDATRKFVKWVNITGFIMIVYFFLIFVCIFWIFLPLILLVFNFSEDRSEQYLHMPLGWLPPSVKSFAAILPAHLVSSVTHLMAIGAYIAWFLVMLLSTIRVTFQIRILSTDLTNLKNRIDEKCTEYFRCSCNGICRPQGSHFDRYGGCSSTSCHQTVLEECARTLIKQAVQQHVDIIKHVKLIDQTFRLVILTYTQLSVVTNVLVIPEFTHVSRLEAWQIMFNCNHIFVNIFASGILCACGQIITDESEKLRFAVYSSGWSELPRGVTRSVCLMGMMAARPLRLTATVFPLNMETFATILKSQYTYANIIITMKAEEIL